MHTGERLKEKQHFDFVSEKIIHDRQTKKKDRKKNPREKEKKRKIERERAKSAAHVCQ